MIKIMRWKHPNIKCQLYGILQGFAELADGIVTVASLGMLMTNFEMTVAARRARSHIQHTKAERAKTKVK